MSDTITGLRRQIKIAEESALCRADNEALAALSIGQMKEPESLRTFIIGRFYWA